MNRTTSFFFDDLGDAGFWASLTDSLRVRHCGFELQCVKLTPDAPPKRRIDGLMLLDAAHSREAAG